MLGPAKARDLYGGIRAVSTLLFPPIFGPQTDRNQRKRSTGHYTVTTYGRMPVVPFPVPDQFR